MFSILIESVAEGEEEESEYDGGVREVQGRYLKDTKKYQRYQKVPKIPKGTKRYQKTPKVYPK